MNTFGEVMLNPEPNKILEHILTKHAMFHRTYVIMGRSGPTGKTWLCNELNTKGFNAVELAENTFDLVEYNDNRNHYRVYENHAVIVLNQILPEYRNRFGKEKK